MPVNVWDWIEARFKVGARMRLQCIAIGGDREDGDREDGGGEDGGGEDGDGAVFTITSSTAQIYETFEVDTCQFYFAGKGTDDALMWTSAPLGWPLASWVGSRQFHIKLSPIKPKSNYNKIKTLSLISVMLGWQFASWVGTF